jgi:hypothetical protein
MRLLGDIVVGKSSGGLGVDENGIFGDDKIIPKGRIACSW